MRLESYAQELEDIILFFVLQGVEKGFYIDVGANDPVNISVTKFFYDRGWNGINIEPLRSKCLLLEEKRPRDINLCVGIGNEDTKLPLITAGTGSTFSKDIAEKSGLINCNQYYKSILTLSEIYEQYCSSNQEIHFCKVDVEGYEKQVLEGINDWKTFRPWIYIMESMEPGTVKPCYEKWERILLENGYVFAYKTEIERYYVDERKEHLLERFIQVRDFIRHTEIVKMKMEKIDTSEI